ncbi:ZW10 interactor-like [Hyla sarda]|uniref:ZW10 interactor-like n=1 Tax=Hyla sarda TaxID=327740 RepID=UPI0024C3D8C8|nr:ZW10 interactor-like [Hyla sarda]
MASATARRRFQGNTRNVCWVEAGPIRAMANKVADLSEERTTSIRSLGAGIRDGMEGNAQRLLDSLSNTPYLDVRRKEEGDGEIPANVLVEYSMGRRRKQKMLGSQLQVLRFLLEFLQEADTANWEDTSPEILNQEVEEVKKKWKSLKCEYQEKVVEVEETIPLLLEKIQLIHDKKTELEEALHRYQAQKVIAEEKAKERQQHLQEVFQKQQLVVQKCQIQIEQLKGEIQKLEQSVECWIQAVHSDSTLAGLLNNLEGVTLVSAEEKELVLDLNVCKETEISPLRVTLHWTSEEEIKVETEDPMPRLPTELQCGATSHIIPIILELQSWYQSHARLLKEMKDLQERFTIDWLPTQMKLLFFKGDKQHTLVIEPGYPMSGGVRLLSGKGAEPCNTADNFKPPVENPSVSDWLEYLQSSPESST